LDRDEFLRQQAAGHESAGFVHRLQAIELIDAGRVEAGDSAPERLHFDGFATFHRAILRDEPCKRFRARLHLSARISG
jgi:hypothetical protein